MPFLRGLPKLELDRGLQGDRAAVEVISSGLLEIACPSESWAQPCGRGMPPGNLAFLCQPGGTRVHLLLSILFLSLEVAGGSLCRSLGGPGLRPDGKGVGTWRNLPNRLDPGTWSESPALACGGRLRPPALAAGQVLIHFKGLLLRLLTAKRTA